MSRGRVLIGMAALCVWSGCSLILDFPELPPGDGGVDANAAACAELEPNDALAAAAPIVSGTFNLSICPAGEHDFFRFDVVANQDVTVDIQFASGGETGDLDMKLYAEIDGSVISVSEGFGTGETIEQIAAEGDQLPAGGYVIEVFPFDASITNDYTMVLTVVDGQMIDAGMPDAML